MKRNKNVKIFLHPCTKPYLLSSSYKLHRDTDIYEVGVDIVGTVDASDWLQTDTRRLVYKRMQRKLNFVQVSNRSCKHTRQIATKSTNCHAVLNLNNGAMIIGVNREVTKSSATAEIARNASNGHSRSFKVIRCCATRRGMTS